MLVTDLTQLGACFFGHFSVIENFGQFGHDFRIYGPVNTVTASFKVLILLRNKRNVSAKRKTG